MSDEYTLFVSNVSQETKIEDLYELFCQAGPVERIRFPVSNEGHRRPFAFVTYKNVSSLKYAVPLLQGTLFEGRSLWIKPSNDQKDPVNQKYLSEYEPHEERLELNKIVDKYYEFHPDRVGNPPMWFLDSKEYRRISRNSDGPRPNKYDHNQRRWNEDNLERDHSNRREDSALRDRRRQSGDVNERERRKHSEDDLRERLDDRRNLGRRSEGLNGSINALRGFSTSALLSPRNLSLQPRRSSHAAQESTRSVDLRNSAFSRLGPDRRRSDQDRLQPYSDRRRKPKSNL